MKIDYHSLLHEYHGLKEYSVIIREAVDAGMPAEETLKFIDKKWGIHKRPMGMKEQLPPHVIIGELGYDIDYQAQDQFFTALKCMPVSRGALMPDAHLGYSLPIGGVVEYENAIFPAGVGFDIGCQVNLSILDIPVPEMEMYRDEIMRTIIEHAYLGLGATRDKAADHPIMNDLRWKEFTPYDLTKARHQLGTLGSGNHFADIVVVRHRTNPDDPAVGLLTHGGSRKTGMNVAKAYSATAEKITGRKTLKVPKNYGWLDMNTTAGQDYYNMMELMVGYACANHQIVHDEIIKAMGTYSVGVLQSIHNYAAEESPGFWVHRKGATPLMKGQLGLIPGTCASTSYIVEGVGREDTLNSTSHGAGRVHSRSEAKRQFSKRDFDITMGDVKYHGIAPDENLNAYKEIERVIQLQIDAKMLTWVAEMEPRIVVMGGE